MSFSTSQICTSKWLVNDYLRGKNSRNVYKGVGPINTRWYKPECHSGGQHNSSSADVRTRSAHVSVDVSSTERLLCKCHWWAFNSHKSHKWLFYYRLFSHHGLICFRTSWGSCCVRLSVTVADNHVDGVIHFIYLFHWNSITFLC